MPIDKTLFRQVVGSFACGVTVITTGIEGGFHGMTASAFSSLSLDPCLVLVCIDRGATTLPALQESGRFNVNILSDSQERLSKKFSSKDTPETHRLLDVDFHLGEFGQPLLDGVLGYLECELKEQYEGGDHIIAVGEVMAAAVGEAEAPLAYFRSQYRELATLNAD